MLCNCFFLFWPLWPLNLSLLGRSCPPNINLVFLFMFIYPEVNTKIPFTKKSSQSSTYLIMYHVTFCLESHVFRVTWHKHGSPQYKDFDFLFNYLCSFRKWWSSWRSCRSTVIYSRLGFTRGEEMVEHCFEIQRTCVRYLWYYEVILDYVLFRVLLCFYQIRLKQNICTNSQFRFLCLTSKRSTNSRFWFAG